MAHLTKTGAAKRGSQADWETLGWQGIILQVPSGWSLTGFGGDIRSGTLRCDSAEPDNVALPIGLEVRWIGSKRAPSESQMRSRADSLLAAIKRSAKRAKVEADTSVFDLGGSCVEGRSPSFGFAWRTDRAASGLIWYCSVCRRTVMAQVYGFGGRPFVQQADAILGALRCHSDDLSRQRLCPPDSGASAESVQTCSDGVAWQTWGLYGLLADVPSDYVLTSQKVMNIYLQLRFQRGRSADTLIVEQWSLANVQLKGVYLDEWFDKKRDETVAGIEIDKSETEVNGHPAVWLDGKRGGLAAVAHGVRSVTRMKRPATYYEGLLWECGESNKAYLIQSISRRPQPDLVEEMGSRLRCHRTHEEQVG